MQTMSYSEVINSLPMIMGRIREEPVTIQERGLNSAVLLSYEEYERLSSLPVINFQNVCDNIGKKAEERGMTAGKLAELLTK